MPADDLPVIAFESQSAWAGWLEAEHKNAKGVWIKLAKRDSGIASVTYSEAVEVALCYGWIDGQAARFDEKHHLQRFTPRRPQSRWSKINRAKAEALTERGAMRPAGRRAIESAKADGRWDAAYESPSNATVPDDLRQALDRNRKAREFFASLDSRNRFAILYRIGDAKRPETRARRIEKYVDMLNKGERLYP